MFRTNGKYIMITPNGLDMSYFRLFLIENTETVPDLECPQINLDFAPVSIHKISIVWDGEPVSL